MGLAENAKAAWAKEKATRRDEVRRRNVRLERKARHQFENVFGAAPDKCSVPGTEYVDYAELEHEGMRFHCWIIPNETEVFSMMGTCPICGKETESEDFSSLAGLGKLLEEGFKPASWHTEECEGNK